MLLIGASNGDWGGRGNISAFDPKDGKRLWQWDTVPGPGDPANKTWSGDSWKRGGAAVWNGLAIDPASNTLYIDTGNPQPDFLGTMRKGKNLYTDSMVALDISGAKPKLKWYHQFIPHDTHDWDPAMPPLLFSGKVDGKTTKLVAAGDKGGNFWILDAATGKLIHHTPVSYQYNQGSEPSEAGDFACPNTNGGVEYDGGSYDPASNTIFVPSINQCGRWKRSAELHYIPGQFYLGGEFPSLVGPNWGWFNAIDVNTGMLSWRHYFDLPANGGALVMTSGSDSVVFTGELNGEFDAFDGTSGKLLWHHDTGASIIAPPSTFVMDGKRYVVVASGQPGFLKVPEMKQQMGPAVLTAFVSGGAATTTGSNAGNVQQQATVPSSSGTNRGASSNNGAAAAPEGAQPGGTTGGGTGATGNEPAHGNGPGGTSGSNGPNGPGGSNPSGSASGGGKTASSSPGIAPKLFTEQQAQAGKPIYAAVCAGCHGEQLQGGSAPASGGTALLHKAKKLGWSVSDLRTLVVSSMPLNNPGSLSSEQYADVLAYLLAEDCYPAGSAPFPTKDTTLLKKAALEQPRNAQPGNAELGTCPVR